MVLKDLISTNIYNPMYNKINLQYIFSYLGIIPYFIVLIDKYLIFKIEAEISLNFILYYTLIICVFIGSQNWNLQKRIPNLLIIYGFLPSLYAVLIIILNLYKFNHSILFLLLNIFLLVQLFFDYFLIFKNSIVKNTFYFLRLPLTLLISMILFIL